MTLRYDKNLGMWVGTGSYNGTLWQVQEEGFESAWQASIEAIALLAREKGAAKEEALA